MAFLYSVSIFNFSDSSFAKATLSSLATFKATKLSLLYFTYPLSVSIIFLTSSEILSYLTPSIASDIMSIPFTIKAIEPTIATAPTAKVPNAADSAPIPVVAVTETPANPIKEVPSPVIPAVTPANIPDNLGMNSPKAISVVEY